jgi:hypothetical protein
MIILGGLSLVRFNHDRAIQNTPSSPYLLENGEFDDIVVGSGFCALAYIDEALRLNPFRKILLLERGGKYLSILRRSSIFILIDR